MYLSSSLHHNNEIYFSNVIDYSVVSAAYKLTIEKKDSTDSAALFMELKRRSLQGEANKLLVSPYLIAALRKCCTVL